jgi:hypothetical protein
MSCFSPVVKGQNKLGGFFDECKSFSEKDLEFSGIFEVSLLRYG